MRNQKTGAITHGAISASIFIVLLLVMLTVPLLNFIVLLFIPLPFMVHMLRYGWKSTLIVGAVVTVLTLIFVPLAVIVTVMATTVGGVMGYFYRNKKGAFAPLIGGALTYLVNYLLVLVVSFVLLDMNVIQAMQQYLQDMVQTTEETANLINLPLDAQQLNFYKEQIQMVSYMFPLIMILSSLLLAGLNHLVSRPILKRLGHSIDSLPPFREWSFPKSLLFYYLVSLLLIILGFAKEGGTLFVILVNVHPVLEILLYIQGLSVVAYFSHQRRMGKALPIITVILTFLLANVVTLIVRMLGIFELGLGIRKRMKSN